MSLFLLFYYKISIKVNEVATDKIDASICDVAWSLLIGWEKSM